MKTNFIMNYDNVRTMCIKHDLCTKCNCDEYEKILNMCDIDVKSFETLKNKLFKIARLIYQYSNEITFECIMYYLMNECVKTFFEFE